MPEPWEQAHTDRSVSLSSFRRDGYVLLSGVIAGAAAASVAGVAHAANGLALGMDPLLFLRDFAALLFGIAPESASGAALGAALGVYLVAGIGLGVVFALAADTLKHRDAILWLALGSGLGLGAVMLAVVQVWRVPLGLPAWELLSTDVLFGLCLVVQQAAMDILERRLRRGPVSHEGEGPVRLPVLGKA